MPRLNSLGQVCAPGSGLGVVSAEGLEIYPSGSDANWLSVNEVAFQGCGSSGCQILAYNVNTQSTRVLDGQGANWLRARDGGWAAWLNGQIRTSAGWVAPGLGYLADVAEGGVLIAGPDLQTLTAYTLGGVQAMAPLATGGPLGDDATSGLNVRVRDRLLLFQAGGAWRLFSLQSGQLAELYPAARVEPISYAVPLRIAGQPWLLERSHRLTLRPYASTLGYVITEELCYGPDAVPLEAGARITWSISGGQPPGDVRVLTYYLGIPPVELNEPEPVEPPVPVEPPDPVEPPNPVEPPEPIEPPEPVPIEPEPATVRHALLPFGFQWVEVVEAPHQDAGVDGRPYCALVGPDGRVLAADPTTGALDWRPAGTVPGAWERFISIPAGYVILRDGYVGLVKRAAWPEAAP